MPEKRTAQAEDTQITTSEEATQQATESAADSETATTESQDQQPKPKGGFQKRIDRLTRRNYDLESKLERQSEQMQELLDRLAGNKPAATEQSQPLDKPRVDKFATYEEYVEALADWKAEQKVNTAFETREKKQREESERHRAAEVGNTFQQRISEARSRYDDFDEVALSPSVPVYEAVSMAIMEMDNGPDVAYFLGSHPEEAKKLTQVSPLAAVAAVGRISAQLAKAAPKEEEEQDSPPPKPAVSSAPAPIKPVKKSAPSDKGLSDDLSVEEWMRRRDAQLK